MSNTSDISEKVSFFFSKIRWRNILTFSFFLILSLIFWVMQVYRQKFETTLAIPVKYVNVPDSIVFDNELPDRISIRVKDDGGALMRYNIVKIKDSLAIDVRKVIESQNPGTLEGQFLEELIKTKLLNSSELVSFIPTQIHFQHQSLERKKLVVVYNGNLDIPSGYILDGEITMYPDSVYAYSSKHRLDTLKFAHTIPDTTHIVPTHGTIDVAIGEQHGIKFVPQSIYLSVPIDEFTQKEVEVPIECINLPPDLNIKFFPSAVKIPFFVGFKRAETIHAGSFRVIVDYDQIDTREKRLTSTPVRITTSPDYIRVKQPIPSEVEFVLEQK